MRKKFLLKKIEEIYRSGGNIIEYLKSLEKREINDIEDILISYDFQAGSYVRDYYEESDIARRRTRYINEISVILKNVLVEDLDLKNKEISTCEVGCGEATTLYDIATVLNGNNKRYGFDISWSRIKKGRSFLQVNKMENVDLVVGDLFHAPYADDSFDLVYTSHSIEPNGGREKEALKELYRIAKKWLVLFEPSYHFGSEEAKSRMKKHGYVTKLHETALALGYDVIEYYPIKNRVNELNPTEVIMIKKRVFGEKIKNQEIYQCPNTGTPLKKHEKKQCFFTEEGLLAYPIIDGIPCLLPENAIVATKFLEE